MALVMPNFALGMLGVEALPELPEEVFENEKIVWRGQWNDAWYPSIYVELSDRHRVRATSRVGQLPGEERRRGPWFPYRYSTPWHGHWGRYGSELHVRFRWKHPSDEWIFHKLTSYNEATKTWQSSRVWYLEGADEFLNNLMALPEAM